MMFSSAPKTDKNPGITSSCRVGSSVGTKFNHAHQEVQMKAKSASGNLRYRSVAVAGLGEPPVALVEMIANDGVRGVAGPVGGEVGRRNFHARARSCRGQKED